MDRALFADATATSIGAIFGTSNTTTYVESAAGIGAGGSTGLTSVVVVAVLVPAMSAFLAPVYQRSALSGHRSCTDHRRHDDAGFLCRRELGQDFAEAVPAFFAGVFMALCYSISYGIAASFYLLLLGEDHQR
jgi:AGZA family xanthine/uracil permease-like MFS transporter